jgi:hypothetical protein
MSLSYKADLEPSHRRGALAWVAAVPVSALKLLLTALDARASVVSGRRPTMGDR